MISFFFLDDEANGDISGDDRSINSDGRDDLHHDENSMDSMDDRDGALNLVSIINSKTKKK